MSTRPVAVQIGRVGDVPGGMSQVVRAYREWPFEYFDVLVVASRDGSRGRHAVGVYLRAAVALAKALSARRGIVVAHMSQGGSFIREGSLMLLARLFGWPVMAQLHGSRFSRFAHRWPRLVRFILSRAAAVNSLSAETSRVVKELVPAVRLYEIPNAVPAGRQQDKQRVVAFGGAISLRKGVDVLVDAWSQIEHRDWKLILAGPIMDERLVRKMDSCTFVGPLPHDELMHLLETASIAVLPSRDEGMPMFLVEAMARGCSVLSTRVGGVPRLVGDGGLLVSAGSTSELKSALQLLMADNDLRASYSVAAHARYRSAYSADVIYPQVESLWQSLVVKAR